MTTQPQGLFTVVVALLGNVLVVLIKSAAALISGSSAMFSEAIHSFADTLNQVLLLVGIVRSKKQATDAFGYGFGFERFFWALLSACSIFFMGAGVTIYHGIVTLIHPEEVHVSAVVYGVLFTSFVVEFLTFFVAARAIKKSFPEHNWRERLELTDPSTLAVFLEDGLAVVGVLIAGLSIGASYYTQNPLWDSIGSLLIGLLLGFVAITLIRKNRSYLMGRSISEERREEIIAFLIADPAIERVIDFKSTMLDIDIYRIKFEIEFHGASLLKEAYQRTYLKKQYEEMKDDYEAFARFCVDYADRIPRQMGKKIDALEQQLKKTYPELRYIDIEIN